MATGNIYDSLKSNDVFLLTKAIEWRYNKRQYEYWRIERRNKYLSYRYHFPKNADLFKLRKKAESGVKVIVEARCGSGWLEGKFDEIPGVIVIAGMAKVMIRDGKKFAIKRNERVRRIVGKGPWEEEKFMLACNILQIIGGNRADYPFIENLLERQIEEFYRVKPVEPKAVDRDGRRRIASDKRLGSGEEDGVGSGSDGEEVRAPGALLVGWLVGWRDEGNVRYEAG